MSEQAYSQPTVMSRMDAWSMATLIIPDEILSSCRWLGRAYTTGSEMVTQAVRWAHTAPQRGEPLLHSKDVPSSQMGNRPLKQKEVRESRMEIRACTEIFQGSNWHLGACHHLPSWGSTFASSACRWSDSFTFGG